jgi:hypothetical protein
MAQKSRSREGSCVAKGCDGGGEGDARMRFFPESDASISDRIVSACLVIVLVVLTAALLGTVFFMVRTLA